VDTLPSAGEGDDRGAEAREGLGLDRVDVIHAGAHTFDLAAGIRAVAFARVFTDVEPL
jgi:hypothetical protein